MLVFNTVCIVLIFIFYSESNKPIWMHAEEQEENKV